MNEARRPQGVTPGQTQSVPQDTAGLSAERPTPQASDDSRSLSELFSGVVENLQNIVRSEVQLAKTELQEEAKKAGKAAAMLGAGALMGFYAVGLLLLTIVWILATQMSDWLAALIVTVVVAVIAGILVMMGKSRMQEVQPKPEETIASVKEDVEWVKQHKP